MNDLLTQAQDDIQMQISRDGADARARLNTYSPWRVDNIVLDVYRFGDIDSITLGQFRSLIEGLGLYMVNGRRARETKFRLSKEGEVFTTNLMGGDIWLLI